MTDRALLVLFVAVLLAPFMGLPAAAEDGEPENSAPSGAQAYFGDAELVTHENRPVRLFTDVLAGQVVLINSFYTSCEGISPRQGEVLARLREALDRNGAQVRFVSITIDPDQDGVEQIRDFATEVEASGDWWFLTGAPETVDSVNRKLGQYVESPADHHGTYLLGNVETELWVKVPVHARPEDLYRQLLRLVADDGTDGSEGGP